MDARRNSLENRSRSELRRGFDIRDFNAADSQKNRSQFLRRISMKRVLFVLGVVLFLFTGCTEEELSRVDAAAVAVKDMGTLAEGVVNSPAAIVIPPDWRLYISLASAAMLAVGNGWQSVRQKKTRLALEEVVVGNEAVKKGKDFADAQNAAQSVGTAKLVSGIRKQVAA